MPGSDKLYPLGLMVVFLWVDRGVNARRDFPPYKLSNNFDFPLRKINEQLVIRFTKAR